ncbi:phosphate ABC transporter permease PstA [Leeia oryzae]|uniref:phosphate ABC transporter permease PstA n=1 Tax=Leeia oryzae TaxID=356662 RepID=UPI0003683623|nr:phosphate ABC transporter permease PstA [Leeia oryzae]
MSLGQGTAIALGAKEMSHFKRRKIKNLISMVAATAATGVGLFFLCWILFTLFNRGFGAMHLDLLTKMTPPPGADGGLLNAIVGSLLMILVSTLIAAPVGVIAGIYLAEYGKNSRLANTIRFINDILLSAPSIVIGLFIYTVVVATLQHFSGWAGSIALAIIAMPIIVRTTENMLLLVPTEMREAAYGLGASQRKTVFTVSLIAAKNGILTGILLAVARISGETAPLLFTALNNQFWSLNMNQPMANLPVVIFQYAMSPYENWQGIAWAGAALITLAVLSLNIITRAVFKQSKY